MKRIYFLTIFFVCILTLTSCRSKTPWNPYLSAKEKPSEKQRKEEQKQLVKGTKNYEEQMKENKKNIQENINKSTSMKKKYKSITRRKRRTKKRNLD
ncbi:MAG: hypothetical protein NTX97_06580 [Bacteroidetes bacterium]|nr:hypothetical protein [Bacteroidota bacterium]